MQLDRRGAGPSLAPACQSGRASSSTVDLGLFIVADGMGGHKAGEVASRWPSSGRRVHPRDARRPRDDLAVSLRSAPIAARPIAWRSRCGSPTARSTMQGERSRAHAGMGTTIVAVLVDGDRIVVGHVGDSRAYCLRGGQLRQMTRTTRG